MYRESKEDRENLFEHIVKQMNDIHSNEIHRYLNQLMEERTIDACICRTEQMAKVWEIVTNRFQDKLDRHNRSKREIEKDSYSDDDDDVLSIVLRFDLVFVYDQERRDDTR